MRISPFRPRQYFNRWQFVCCTVIPLNRMADVGWREFNFGVFKIVDPPQRGELITPRKLKGFWWRKMVWLPWEKS